MATNPTQIQQTQVGFAPEIAPFATTLLGQAQGFADPNIPYEAYTGDRFAQFTPMQKQSYEGAQSMQPAYQLMGATGLAGLAGQQALKTQYRPMNYQTGSITDGGMGGMGGMGGTGDMGGGLGSLGGGLNKLLGVTGQFDGSANQQSVPSMPVPTNPNLQPTTYGGQNITNVQASYMSPFMQGAVDPAIKEAKRQSDIMGQANAAKAVSVGAFGGSLHIS